MESAGKIVRLVRFQCQHVPAGQLIRITLKNQTVIINVVDVFLVARVYPVTWMGHILQSIYQDGRKVFYQEKILNAQINLEFI